MIFMSPGDRSPTAPALRKARVSRTIDAVLLVALGCGFVAQVLLLSKADADVVAVFLRALLASSLLSAVPIAVLWFLDRRERESPWMLAAAFLWGGLIATALSMPLNTVAFRAVDRWIALNPVVSEILGPEATILIAAPLSAPIVEELMKGAGVVVILWMLRGEFDGMRDGFIYGALVGAGFNWLEAPLYVMQGYGQHGVAPYARELGLRYGLLGLGGHALFTGVFGLFLGLAAQTSRGWVRVGAPILGFVIAVGAHLLNNSLPLLRALLTEPEAQAVAQAAPAPEADLLTNVGFLEAAVLGVVPQLTIFLPLALIVVIGLWRSGVWERRVVREELASEVGRCISASDYQAIIKDRMLRTRRISEVDPERSAAIVNAQHELAFRKRRVKREGRDPEQDELVAGWRRDILELRGNASL